MSRRDRAVAREREQVVLVAHSLGCLAVAWRAVEASAPRLAKVRGALLVAPQTPALVLPFPTLLIASRDDRYAAIDRSARLAALWDYGLGDAGARGHINAGSGIGDWPEGGALLDQLIEASSSRPISMRRTSLVPAPISSSLASR